MDVRTPTERFITEELMFSRSGQLDATASLLHTGVLDSLNLIRLILFLEQQFGVTIDDNEVIPDHFETLNAIERFVSSKLQPA